MKRGRSVEVLLAEQPDRDAVGDAAAAALALVGGRLRDRLDRQPLHLQPRAVARDAGRAGVHHVADAGHGQRRLGHVGGEHDAPALVRFPHALLRGRGLAREQRQDLDVVEAALERFRGVADLALAGQEHEDVAGRFAQQLVDRVADGVGLVGVLLRLAVADLDRVGAPADLDDRRVVEVLGEALRVDRRGRDDHLQVRPPREQPLEVAEQEVDVQRPLVRLVDDDRVVAAQQPVVLDLGQQQAVRAQPQQRVLAGLVREPHRVADRGAQRHLQLVGDPLRDRARRQPARLRVRDRPADAAAQLQADLRELRRLARARLARDDHDLVVADGVEQVLAPGGDRQLLRIGDRGDRGAALLEPGGGLLDVTIQPLTRLRIALGQALDPLREAELVLDRQLGEARLKHAHLRYPCWSVAFEALEPGDAGFERRMRAPAA